jgi:hypothetical protein
MKPADVSVVVPPASPQPAVSSDCPGCGVLAGGGQLGALLGNSSGVLPGPFSDGAQASGTRPLRTPHFKVPQANQSPYDRSRATLGGQGGSNKPPGNRTGAAGAQPDPCDPGDVWRLRLDSDGNLRSCDEGKKVNAYAGVPYPYPDISASTEAMAALDFHAVLWTAAHSIPARVVLGTALLGAFLWTAYELDSQIHRRLPRRPCPATACIDMPPDDENPWVWFGVQK